MIPILKVKKAGVYGSIQDRGRYGFRRFGVPVSGPMDIFAFEKGHNILNNSTNAAALELFIGGQVLEILADHRIVITGADLGARIDGKVAPLWKSFYVNKGQSLTFEGSNHGSICYVIPEGGFHSENMLESASVNPQCQLGRSIEKDTVLSANKVRMLSYNRGLIKSEIPDYSMNIRVKVWPSPHLHLFNQVEEFFQTTYTFKGGDRMGYLLDGLPLTFANGKSDILSEATQFGTIQVPNNRQPIILMADAQTTGGYATIGKVADEDLWKVAQLRVGGKMQFYLS